MSESDKKNALIPFTPTTLTRLNRGLCVVNKLLAKSWTKDQLRVIEFCVRNPDYFIESLSAHFPLSDALLERFKGDKYGEGFYSDLDDNSRCD